MAPRYNKIKFPLWQFLNQPIFSSKTKLVLNPRRFLYLYSIHLLERCLAKDYEPGKRYPR
ncbi:hypothetical protein H6F74_08605 [Trichocoleus sp. FACHB-90]|uniref:hypothetical protein n=1 Tax=Cyanophyceae TaxID=3028117 RepID=UPI001686CA9E|nr:MULTISPECIES: hypothetical protein [unclassified Trichocoleus]MBD1836325.1 hypothetical protein [Cyanobacteria bacterium FACHB-472]MBD1926308.1 hypothetical protein [Trichocoleus sp. FACHB-90]MBD1930261.1 hypothetical protein [Trichocoleus sp. FACHB-69]